MQFTKSILVCAFAIIGASAAPCSPTDPLPGNGAGGTGGAGGAGGASGSTGTPCGVNQTQYYGSCDVGPLGIINCLPALLGSSQTGFCCNNNNGKCTANSGILNGNTFNICVLGGILGPCSATTG